MLVATFVYPPTHQSITALWEPHSDDVPPSRALNRRCGKRFTVIEKLALSQVMLGVVFQRSAFTFPHYCVCDRKTRPISRLRCIERARLSTRAGGDWRLPR